jgi:hypothetical protein
LNPFSRGSAILYGATVGNVTDDLTVQVLPKEAKRTSAIAKAL